MKIVAAVPVRNRENFIGPYLEMLTEFGVRPIVTFGEKPWVNYASDESEVPDRTEYILDKFFPDIQTIKGPFSHHRDSVNRARMVAGEYDIIIVNDCDMFITRNDWEELVRFIENNKSYQVYSVNFERMIIEYYYDWDYGKPAIRGGDPPIVAMRPMVEFQHMTRTSCGNELVWDVDGPKFHHMRFCQKNRLDRKCAIPADKKDFTPAPEEIVNRLIKWQQILKTI